METQSVFIEGDGKGEFVVDPDGRLDLSALQFSHPEAIGLNGIMSLVGKDGITKRTWRETQRLLGEGVGTAQTPLKVSRPKQRQGRTWKNSIRCCRQNVGLKTRGNLVEISFFWHFLAKANLQTHHHQLASWHLARSSEFCL